MGDLWMFFPGHDIALADGRAGVTLPPAAVRLQRAGELLPLWMGAPVDRVACDGVNARWLDGIRRDFGIEMLPWDHRPDLSPRPWGWSKAVRRVFENLGYQADMLPSDAELDRIRALSHRRSALRLNAELQCRLDFEIWPTGIEVFSADELHSLLIAHPDSVIKAPWSSSGRGITFTDSAHIDQAVQRAAGTIRRQGSVTVEHRARRVTDFAMLFDYHLGATEYCGLSMFSTSDRGQYCGNIVDCQSELESLLSQQTDITQVNAVREAIPAVLDSIFTDGYHGPVGIDMMVVESEDGRRMLHAAVEINLRYTMGFVALALARFVDGRSRFAIEAGDHTAGCVARVSNGLLQSGRLALNPPGGDFTFVLERQ
ncbi:MAG: hypothetical protein Q4C34_07735 [Bacteroidales bacterium]|nr:hypothetical protein [Bacteroidales bacterium]